ncbi:hypothetical protein RU97_GL002213 [Enterococcus canis]|uniref:HTH merR-type domain-containing protein n=1 Tax=Enterococcus canis TaxID=214095 RepID=A0A1L8RED1_9ENTE|nr:MerR family transcriptional regulator [Enterococcus canis]OJG18140.1 hypothetical protein RU97_GL002213 [Enterococcus canis]
MKRLLSISEMAAYAGVSRRTLLYYDEINLFKPTQIGENGYRYYGIEQYEELDLLLILRALGMPLQDIRQFLKNRNPAYAQKEFTRQRAKIDRKIQKLQETRTAIDGYLARYEKLAQLDFEELTYNYRPAEYFLASEWIENVDEMNTFEVYTRFYSLVEARDLFSGHPIGFMSEGRYFQQQNFHAAPYRALVKLPEERLSRYPKEQILQRPAGTYVSGFTRDELHQLTTFNDRFRRYLETHELVIDGDIWELLWQDETAAANREQQVFEVMLPVKPRNQ